MPDPLAWAIFLVLTIALFYLLYMFHESLRGDDQRKTLRMLLHHSPPGTTFDYIALGQRHPIRVTVGSSSAAWGHP